MPEDSYARGPGHTRTPGPIPTAYADTGAIDRDCPHCGAEAGSFCIHDGISGRVERKVPCLARSIGGKR